MKKVLSVLILSLGLSQVAFAAQKNLETKKVEAKTVRGWIKSHPKTTVAIITALLAAGTKGFVYFCPENSVSVFITEKTTSAKNTVVKLPATAWSFSKEHYIAVPASVVSMIILGDLLRGEKSFIKNKVFKKQITAQKEVDAALAK